MVQRSTPLAILVLIFIPFTSFPAVDEVLDERNALTGAGNLAALRTL